MYIEHSGTLAGFTYVRGEDALDRLGVVRVDELGAQKVEEEASGPKARKNGARD